MSIRMLYSPLIKSKIRRFISRAEETIPVNQDPRYSRPRDRSRIARGAFIQGMCGLTLGYLEGILAEDHTEPSGRVIKNLGFEILVRDLETGETEVVEFLGRCEVDHSDPANPKMIVDEEETA